MGVSPGPWPPNAGQTVERSAVSELLAGTRSGPGRSPGAARVRGGRFPTPAGAAPTPLK